MSKEQKSAESNNDEQVNESSGSLSQNEDNTKHANLDIPSNTTLQDLPIELLEMILIRAVVMEVKGLKLAKCAWKEKADPVISRLERVCSQWSNILTSDHFRIVLHRTLNDTAPETIRLEVLQELLVKEEIRAMATLKDEIFTLTKVSDECYIINVYDRDNMEEVKDVIKLPESDVKRMTACNASNCLYVGLEAERHKISSLSVLRIWKDAEHHFNISPWKHVYERSIHMLPHSSNGNLLTYTGADCSNPASVAVHNPNDSLQHEIFLPRYLGVFRYILQKSNGNLVVSYDTEKDYNTKLVEISTTSVVVRHYESSLKELSRVNCADDCDRIMIAECRRMELLDSEFNLLGLYSLEQDIDERFYVYDLYYDRERSVIMRSHNDYYSDKNVLTTFRFTEK